MTDTPLRGFQRKHLRGLAHGLNPAVQVGHAGVTDAVITALDSALADHELIKVAMHRPADKKALAAELAARSGAHLCGTIGHIAILYRPRPGEPTIQLPQREGDAAG